MKFCASIFLILVCSPSHFTLQNSPQNLNAASGTLNQSLAKYLLLSTSDNNYPAIKNLIVKKRARVLLEHVSGSNSPHPVQSITKSIVSLLTGIAVQQGCLKVTDRVISFFPEYRKVFNSGWENVTIENLLMMRSGIEWNEDLMPEPVNPLLKMYNAQDLYRYIFSLQVSEDKEFNYCSANAALLSGIIYRATGMATEKFAENFLFFPIGINKYSWEKYRNGSVNTSAGLFLRTSDFVKIGELILQNGKWNNNEIVPEDWIKQSFTPYSKLQGFLDVNSYGYLFWINNNVKIKGEARPRTILSANGYNNNHLIIEKETNLIIVITDDTKVYAGNYFELVKGIMQKIPAGRSEN